MRKMLQMFVVFLVLPALVFAGGKSETSDELTGSIKIAGSSTVYPISVAVAEEFFRMHPGVEIPVQSTGTGGGFKNFFVTGKTDINGASRGIKDSEREAAIKNGNEPIEFQVATDGLTVVVSPKATWIDDVTVEDLAKIWRPDNPAMKWSDVKPEWPDEELELYGPTSASGTFDFFTDVVVGEEGYSRSDYQGTEQDNTIVQAVSGSEFATGYFGMAYYLENKDRVKALKVNGIAPSIESAKNGSYTPLARPLYIYVSKESLKRPEVEAYVRFYLEQISTSLISEIGYVPMSEADQRAALEKLDKVLAEMQ